MNGVYWKAYTKKTKTKNNKLKAELKHEMMTNEGNRNNDNGGGGGGGGSVDDGWKTLHTDTQMILVCLW